jgi:signal-transduction protein with cAMP-binding, CBS, and nucleotidyltransferase domain
MRIITPEDASVLQVCLDCLPFFDTFSDQEKQDLLGGGADLISYETGEFLIEEGGDDQMLFFLLSGAASVVKKGASIPIAELKPGDLFGEMAFLTEQKRTSNVIVHPVSSSNTQSAASVLSEALSTQLCPDDPSPTISLRFNRVVLDQIAKDTRFKIKDQIIAVLVARMEDISEVVEESFGEAPAFPIDPELDKMMAEGVEENLEQIKDQIILHLVEFIVLLNQKMLGDT